jgi:AGZA family xanthine/uracil permease-like MFS transporter
VATETRPSTSSSGLDSFFHISERGSTVRTEVLAGVATWLTMAYILFVNPQILGALPDRNGLQLPFPQVLTVTALVAGVMCLLMGLYANYPFALAAGLGLNAFVAFTLVGGNGLTWPEAMGVIVVEGLAIAVLVLTGLREMILNAIPMDLKRAIGIGIGLFIAFIGLQEAGIVVHPEAGTIVALNPDLTTLPMLIFAIGLAVTGALVVRRTRGALLIGILFTTAVAIAINYLFADKGLYDTPGVGLFPSKIFQSPDFSLVGDVSFNFFKVMGTATALAAVLSVMLSDFFDTMGTVIGLGGEAGLLDKDGKLPGIKKVLLVDSVAAAAGGAASASSNTTYIESASGIAEGGRTGLTSVVVGLLFLASLFLSPIAGIIPVQATAPVLVIVGYFMMTLVRDIAWNDPAIGIPALITMIVMPLTFSITNGVAAGFVSYTVINLLGGRWKDVHPLMFIVSGVFVWYFLHGIV